MWKYQNADELYHHGIIGQKWGIRRYQNKDGSLTKAGKKRADKLKTEYTELTGKKLIRKSTNTKNATQNKEESTKSVKDMSDVELRNKINRIQMERQYATLQPKHVSRGQRFVSAVGKNVIAPAATEAGKRVLTEFLTKVGKDIAGLNPEQTKDSLAGLKKEVETLELQKRKTVAENYLNSNKKKKKE